MNRISGRSDVGRLIAVLERAPSQRCSIDELGAHFPTWTCEKLERVIDAAAGDPMTQVKRGARRVIRYTGSERFGEADSVGLYLEVKRIVEKHWEHKPQYRDVQVEIVGRTRDRSGHEWSCPDLVMHCLPGRRNDPDERRQMHAIEVETGRGFSIRSVYQAHAQGRGSDFSWVLFQQLPADTHRPTEWERILWAAGEVGVGLVGFANSNSHQTWTTFLEPKLREATEFGRQQFARFISSSSEQEGHDDRTRG